MNIRKTILAMLAMALAVGLLGACGGDDTLSDQEYSDKLGEALTPLSEIQNIQGDLSGSDNLDDVASTLEQAQAAFENAATTLEEINPPSEVEEENQQLVTAFRDFTEAVDPVIQAARDGDAQQLQEAGASFPQELQTFQQEVQDAAQSLEDAGIPEPDLPGSGS